MNKAANIVSTVVVLFIITTLVLPGRQTVGVSNSFFNGVAKVGKTGLGQG